MKTHDGQCYVEVKNKQYRTHPSENSIIRLRKEPKSLRTQYQMQSNTQIRKNQDVIKNKNDESVVKNYPKTKQPIRQLKF